MKGPISELARVSHMVDAARQIEIFMTDVDHDIYQHDLKLQFAITRLIEIIGEASNHVQEETKRRFPDVEWRILKGVRNIIVHEYFGINYETIWVVTQQDIPTLLIQLEEMLRQLTPSEESRPTPLFPHN
jgi:uncharacterized protein with HEPN domain